MNRRAVALIFFASLPAACGGGGTTPSPPVAPVSPLPAQSNNRCGTPPPVPPPFLWLASPSSGSKNVSTAIGLLIFAGMPQGLYDTAHVTMVSASGANVPVGAYTTAPSPSPTPYPTPPGSGENIPYLAAAIPALSPATTYTLTYTYTDFNGVPPACTGPVTLPLGSFTTQ